MSGPASFRSPPEGSLARSTAPGQVWAGFRFIDVSARSLQHIRQWVEQPGSDYV